MAKRYFGPAFFEFFEQLKRNNNRDWFQRNKNRYESDVREPMLAFIGDLGPILRKISRYYVADPRPSGGSMFRIYRNLRFSRDKTPYKTNAAFAIHHSNAGYGSTTGFYGSISADETFAGMGMWRPEPDTLRKVRDAIVARQSPWKKATSDRAFSRRLEVMGERLARPPKGYDPAHPLIDDLKLKYFVAGTQFTRKEASSTGFLDLFANTCEAGAPFMKFLNEALGLKW